ncbi:MAG: plasmid mobilization relaxosome protein MobC [Clostridia bacterium]|nr:plasmid mobilization relaxosome protein MobC [Clostridia bacterium]
MDKTERIFIRVSPTEKKEIEKKASLVNKSVANYLITLSENKRVVDTSKLPPLILEIRRIGVNINQIAAVANSQKYINKELLSKVNENLKEVIGLLQQILEEVYNTEEHTFQSLETKIDKLTKAVEGIGDDGNSQGNQKIN